MNLFSASENGGVTGVSKLPRGFKPYHISIVNEKE
jgi:hypothetical protein